MTQLHEVVVTGLGVVTAIGDDVDSFTDALRRGHQGITERPGHDGQAPVHVAAAPILDIGQVLDRMGPTPTADRARAARVLAGVSVSLRRAVAAACEAWRGAGLAERGVPHERSGIVVGGTNLTLDHFTTAQIAAQRSPNYVRPTTALRVLDTDHVGVISHVLPIHGEGLVAGGASASGNLAVATAARMVALGDLDVCLVVASSPELTAVEAAAYRNIGALAVGPPGAPFTAARCGFVPATAAAAVVLERAGGPGQAEPVRLRSWFAALDGNSFANPSLAGEVAAMRSALERAGVRPGDVDYVNAHGSGSLVGDETEAQAIATVFGTGDGAPVVNATKALVGHALGAAGLVELVATVVQLASGFVHPHPGEPDPALPPCRFAGPTARPAGLRVAVTNGFGFGGFNSALVLSR